MSRWLQLFSGWFRPRLETEENALESFERLWTEQESGHRINFMSIAINASDHTGAIEDVGLSHWSKQALHQQVTYHWRIGEKVEIKDVVKFGNPDSFNFGTTQTITAHDVTTVLDDWVLSLSGNCEELCVVIYGNEAFNTLAKHWKSPVPVVMLDLETAWHQRQHKAEHLTLEDVAATTKDLANASSALDNAGNRAEFLLTLLKSLPKKSKDSSLVEWEDASQSEYWRHVNSTSSSN